MFRYTILNRTNVFLNNFQGQYLKLSYLLVNNPGVVFHWSLFNFVRIDYANPNQNG